MSRSPPSYLPPQAGEGDTGVRAGMTNLDLFTVSLVRHNKLRSAMDASRIRRREKGFGQMITDVSAWPKILITGLRVIWDDNNE